MDQGGGAGGAVVVCGAVVDSRGVGEGGDGVGVESSGAEGVVVLGDAVVEGVGCEGGVGGESRVKGGDGVEGADGDSERDGECTLSSCRIGQQLGGEVGDRSAFRFFISFVILGLESTCCWCVGGATGVAATAA